MPTLMIGDDGGGPRHFLEGRPVHAGTMLELLTVAGWQLVRYEAEGQAEDSVAVRLFAADGELLGVGPDTVLRWPAPGGTEA